MTVNLKQCRPVKEGMRGRDIVAYKRALSRAGFIEWEDAKFTPYAGPFFTKAVKHFQHNRGLAQDGQIGAVTHNKLLDARRKSDTSESAWDLYSIDMYKDFCDAFNEHRDGIIDAARYWWSINSKINYAQIRPIINLKPPAYSALMDCSWYATICYFAGNAEDPNGRGFDGQGYTGTLLAHGRRITRDKLKPADLVFYGFHSGGPAFPTGAPTHVALYAGGGKVYSMGSSVGPSFYDINYRSDINAYTTCL
jgi:hypothetical protein